MAIEKTNKPFNHFFVDEAGDLTLFDKKGKIIVGNEGVSKIFMVGLAQIENISEISTELESLRSELIKDPYFGHVPSFRSEEKKTAIVFHAKDDLPEVRREVFKLLSRYEINVIVAIKRKKELAELGKSFFRFSGQRLKENNVYDELVMRIFRNVLHLADENKIYFARRGQTSRTEALENAIQSAKNNFELKYGKKSDKPVVVSSMYPSQEVGLQVIDYFLWALQRMFERNEDRYFNSVSEKYKLIMDLDDKRNKDHGEWYNSGGNKLELTKIKPV
jgi:Protein of unknown function (DUF3800)